jgi:hypothetical protein
MGMGDKKRGGGSRGSSRGGADRGGRGRGSDRGGSRSLSFKPRSIKSDDHVKDYSYGNKKRDEKFKDKEDKKFGSVNFSNSEDKPSRGNFRGRGRGGFD